ncbi:DUF333 domain-containing protein [Bartonella sp. DGB1]|uniref:putative hemolysin n=1 Tax=Bartonella sp. DGB1 TaxID=3239807 RepID=UPI0035259614
MKSMNLIKKLQRSGFIVGLTIFLIACEKDSNDGKKPNLANPAAEKNLLTLANPAAVHCKDIGGKLYLYTDEDGGQTGYCEIKKGVICEEWELFRSGKCDQISEEKKKRLT